MWGRRPDTDRTAAFNRRGGASAHLEFRKGDDLFHNKVSELKSLAADPPLTCPNVEVVRK